MNVIVSVRLMRRMNTSYEDGCNRYVEMMVGVRKMGSICGRRRFIRAVSVRTV